LIKPELTTVNHEQILIKALRKELASKNKALGQLKQQVDAAGGKGGATSVYLSND